MEELIERNIANRFISPIVTDGCHYLSLRSNYEEELGIDGANNILNNALGALKYFPKLGDKSISKILCVGKVQSGKTSFFITTTSLAFDNGYKIAYLIGGTSLSLRDQNKTRTEEEFLNDELTYIVDLNDTSSNDIKEKIEEGKCVIVVALKNASRESNLNRLNILSKELSDIPSLIIDDEADEISPGADKLKKKNNKAGKTHDVIVEIINNIETGAYLEVTATPEANILIGICNEISPDYAMLVEPGVGYTGGASFHDDVDNEHIVTISDYSNFNDSIPETFVDALYFYMFACCKAYGDGKKYSMLVHPSVLQSVHNDVATRIKKYINSLCLTLSNKENIDYQDKLDRFSNAFLEYARVTPDSNLKLDRIMSNLPFVLSNLDVTIYNKSKFGRDSLENFDDSKLFNIYVGGNMLGRGITLPNLIVTYMYRETKIPAVDTLYQRARWFGYKSKYFDLCRVYMTDRLKRDFVAAADHEEDMWNKLRAFLSVKIDFRKFTRVFELNDETGKMRLTRPSVSKTITISQTNIGYTPDESIDYKENEILENRMCFEQFFSKWRTNGKPESFSTDNKQTHYVIKMKFLDFYNDYLSKIKYPFGSKFSIQMFERMLDDIDDNDDFYVMVMRYDWKDKPSRDTKQSGRAVKRLAQGANANTKYEGDRYISKYKDKLYFQIHNIVCEEVDGYIPILAMNNPLNEGIIRRYVTGDNDYGI